MKKVFLVLAICLGFSLSLTSCKDKEHKQSEETHELEHVEDANKEKELASNSVYQCPMNCEEGKSYIKEGSCPVCKMDLKPKEVDMDSDSEHEEGQDKDAEDHDKGTRIMEDAKVESTPKN